MTKEYKTREENSRHRHLHSSDSGRRRQRKLVAPQIRIEVLLEVAASVSHNGKRNASHNGKRNASHNGKRNVSHNGKRNVSHDGKRAHSKRHVSQQAFMQSATQAVTYVQLVSLGDSS